MNGSYNIIRVIQGLGLGLYRDNGKLNGSYYNGLYRGYRVCYMVIGRQLKAS